MFGLGGGPTRRRRRLQRPSTQPEELPWNEFVELVTEQDSKTLEIANQTFVSAIPVNGNVDIAASLPSRRNDLSAAASRTQPQAQPQASARPSRTTETQTPTNRHNRDTPMPRLVNPTIMTNNTPADTPSSTATSTAVATNNSAPNERPTPASMAPPLSTTSSHRNPRRPVPQDDDSDEQDTRRRGKRRESGATELPVPNQPFSDHLPPSRNLASPHITTTSTTTAAPHTTNRSSRSIDEDHVQQVQQQQQQRSPPIAIDSFPGGAATTIAATTTATAITASNTAPEARLVGPATSTAVQHTDRTAHDRRFRLTLPIRILQRMQRTPTDGSTPLNMNRDTHSRNRQQQQQQRQRQDDDGDDQSVVALEYNERVQQILLDWYLQIHEVTQLERAAKRAEHRHEIRNNHRRNLNHHLDTYDDDDDGIGSSNHDDDLLSLTTHQQIVLQEFLFDQGIALTSLQVQTLAEAMVYQQQEQQLQWLRTEGITSSLITHAPQTRLPETSSHQHQHQHSHHPVTVTTNVVPEEEDDEDVDDNDVDVLEEADSLYSYDEKPNQPYLPQPDLCRIPTTPSQSVSMVEIAEEDEMSTNTTSQFSVPCHLDVRPPKRQLSEVTMPFELYHPHSRTEHDQDNRQNHHQVGDHGEEMQIPPTVSSRGTDQAIIQPTTAKTKSTDWTRTVHLAAEREKQKHPAILSSSAHARSANTGQFSDEDFMDDGQVEALLHVMKATAPSDADLPMTNFLRHQQAAMVALDRRKLKPQPSLAPTDVTISRSSESVNIPDFLQQRDELSDQNPDLSLQSGVGIGVVYESSSSPNSSSRYSSSGRRKSGRSIGLQEDADDGSMGRPTKSPDNSTKRSSVQSTTHLRTTFTCQACLEFKRTKGNSLACNNIQSPHLFCKDCVRRHVQNLGMALGNESSLCQVACLCGNGACRGTLYFRPSILMNNTIESRKLTAVEKVKLVIQEAFMEVGVRSCPLCHEAFVKDDRACNKMTCPCCKATSCYVCRKEISGDGYSHFDTNERGVANSSNGSASGKKCPLWIETEHDISEFHTKRHYSLASQRRTDMATIADQVWETCFSPYFSSQSSSDLDSLSYSSQTLTASIDEFLSRLPSDRSK